MKALVTGSAGFVGRNMVRALQDRGYEVDRVDLRASGVGSRVQDVREFFKTDDTRYDLVVHLAAVVGGRAKIEGEPLSVAVDLSIDAEMFGWAVRTKQPRVVYYSSSAAYPVSLQGDDVMARSLRETDINFSRSIGVPDQTYGWAKLTGEMLAEHARAQGVKVFVFRPFSGYGLFQDLNYPFPSIIRRAEQRLDPFPIWGDGTQVRDWIHIEDVVEATLVAVEQDVEGATNLCTGRATRFNDLVRMVCRQYGYEPEIEHLLDKPVGVHYRVGDPTKMLRFYSPRISLEKAVALAWEGSY